MDYQNRTYVREDWRKFEFLMSFVWGNSAQTLQMREVERVLRLRLASGLISGKHYIDIR